MDRKEPQLRAVESELPPTVSSYWQKRRVWDRYEEENDPVIGKILQEQRELVVQAVREFAEPVAGARLPSPTWAAARARSRRT